MTDCSERKEKLYEENLHGDDECNVVCIDKHLLLQEWINIKEELPLITAHTPSKIFYGVSRGIGDAQNEVNVETSFISQLDCKRKSRKQRTGLHDGEARSLSVIRSLRKRLSEGLADRTSPIDFTLTINSKDDYLDRDWGRGPGEGLATSASLTTLTLTINSKDEYLDRDWGRYLGKSLVKSSSLTAFNLTINSKHRYLGGDWGKGLGEGLAKSTSLTAFTLTINSEHGCLDRDWGKGLGEGLAKSTSLTAFTLTINSEHTFLNGDWGKDLHEALARSTLLTAFTLTINGEHVYLNGDWGKDLGEGVAKSTSLTAFTLTINSGQGFLNGNWGKGLGEGLARSTSLTAFTLTINGVLSYLRGNLRYDLSKALAKSMSLTAFTLTINGEHKIRNVHWGKGLGEGLAKRNERKRKEFTFPFPSFDLDMGVYLSPLSYMRNRLISHGEEKLGSGSPNFPKCSTKSTEREIKRGIFAPFPDTRNDRMRKEYTMLFGNLRIADSGALDGFFSSFNPDRGVCESPRSFKRNRPINHGEKTLHSGSQNFSKYSTKLTEQKIKRCIVPPCPYTRNERMQKKCTKKCGDEIFVGKDENIPEVLL